MNAVKQTGQHALFPGTFDPVTLGHVDVLARACQLFDTVTVAVATHHEKAQLFDLKERIALLTEVAQEFPGTQVLALDGLLVDGCREVGANVIIRGIRGVQDLEYERQMAITNRVLAPEIETVFLLPDPSIAQISSSLVRQIARMGGPVEKLVPDAVRRALSGRFQKDPS